MLNKQSLIRETCELSVTFVMGVLGDGVICLVQAVVFVYDILTFPLYTVSQRPWVRRGAINKLRSDVVEENEESVTIRAKPRMTKPLQVGRT